MTICHNFHEKLSQKKLWQFVVTEEIRSSFIHKIHKEDWWHAEKQRSKENIEVVLPASKTMIVSDQHPQPSFFKKNSFSWKRQNQYPPIWRDAKNSTSKAGCWMLVGSNQHHYTVQGRRKKTTQKQKEIDRFYSIAWIKGIKYVTIDSSIIKWHRRDERWCALFEETHTHRDDHWRLLFETEPPRAPPQYRTERERECVLTS